MNILFLGGAKRVSMGRKFLNAAKRLDPSAPKLYSYELATTEAIAAIATIVPGRRWADPETVSSLARLVEEKAIDVVVPFVDKSIEIAVRLRDEVGARVFVPAGALGPIVAMSDKRLAAEAFAENGIAAPHTYVSLAEADSFPIIAKPRFGAAAKGIAILRNAADIAAFNDHGEEYIFQEYIENAHEITVDCYRRVDSGQTLCVSPRRRLETAGGEVVATLTLDNPEAVTLATEVLEALDLRGAVTVQLLERDGRLWVMEVNPRLGGGAVATCCAGTDLPTMIIAEALGMPAEASVPESGILVKRYLEEISFRI